MNAPDFFLHAKQPDLFSGLSTRIFANSADARAAARRQAQAIRVVRQGNSQVLSLIRIGESLPFLDLIYSAGTWTGLAAISSPGLPAIQYASISGRDAQRLATALLLPMGRNRDEAHADA